MSNQQIFDVWCSAAPNNKYERVFDFILGNISNGSNQTIDLKKLKIFVSKICHDILEKWRKSQRLKSKFLKINSEWLAYKIDFSVYLSQPSISKSRGGRPTKNFVDCCRKTKTRKAKEIVKGTTPNELLMAAAVQLHSSGKRSSAAIVTELANASPKRGVSIKMARMSNERLTTLSPDQALAMIIDTDLSTHKYRLVRQHTKAVHPKIYPSYDLVSKSKRLCYPNGIVVTESYAAINL